MSKTLKVFGALIVALVLLGTAALFASYFIFFSAKVGTISSVKTQAAASSDIASYLGSQADMMSGVFGEAQPASAAFDLYTVEYKNDYELEAYLSSGADTQEAFDKFLSDELLFGMLVAPDAYGVAGSALSAAAADGHLLTAKNADSFITDIGMIWTEPDDGYASVSLVDLGALGFSSQSFMQKMQVLLAPYFPQDGMNEKGLTVSLLRVFGEPAQRDGGMPLPPTVMARVLLDKAATVDEAETLLNQYGMAAWYADGDFQLYVTDKTGATLLAQYAGGELHLTRDVSAVTNYFLSDEITQPEENRLGQIRMQRLNEGLADQLNRESAMDTLRTARSSRYEGKETPGLQTVYSVVFDKTAGEVDVCFGEDFETVYTFRADERELVKD